MSSALRRGGGALLALLLAMLASATAAFADGTVTFVPSGPLTWSATAPSGMAQSFPVTVGLAQLSNTGLGSDQGAPPPGQAYFDLSLSAGESSDQSYVIVQSVPVADVQLVTSAGTVTPAWSNSTGSLGVYDFLVPQSTTSASIDIPALPLSVADTSTTNQVTFAFSVLAIGLTAEVPPASPVTTPPTSAPRQTASGAPVKHSSKGASSLVAKAVGGGGGVLVVLVVLPIFVRRRRFASADRQGRVVIVAPPALGTAAPTEALPPGRVLPAPPPQPGPSRARKIVVKVLGALDFAGVSLSSGPLKEILVFLVLNPGQSFTSAELRAAIWVGRPEVKSATLDSYLSRLRRALGRDVLVRKGFRFELTEVVTSDWASYQALAEAGDEGVEQALELVRGPVLFGSFDEGFSWAGGDAGRITRTVVDDAERLGEQLLQAGKGLRADFCVAGGILCSPTDKHLRLLDLAVGAEVGGPAEVGRRLQVAIAVMADFPGDVADLIAEARRLGYEAA